MAKTVSVMIVSVRTRKERSVETFIAGVNTPKRTLLWTKEPGETHFLWWSRSTSVIVWVSVGPICREELLKLEVCR
ncbi:hypothetical protein AMECASPLE_026381 [Ameca splendens]|uniref:Uncharacterized protein n=1 Tax=Ameca splendens TaxID=208324 RepID=A0ABV1A0F7_9TELE